MRQQSKKIQDLFLKEFGENIKKIRKRKKLTQMDVAMRINGDASKISKIERGVYNFNFTSFLVIAQALDVKLHELIAIENIDFFIKNILEDID